MVQNMKKFITVEDLKASQQDRRVTINKEKILERLKKFLPDQFLFVEYSISSPPEVMNIEPVPNNDLIGFVKSAMNKANISVEDLKQE